MDDHNSVFYKPHFEMTWHRIAFISMLAMTLIQQICFADPRSSGWLFELYGKYMAIDSRTLQPGRSGNIFEELRSAAKINIVLDKFQSMPEIISVISDYQRDRIFLQVGKWKENTTYGFIIVRSVDLAPLNFIDIETPLETSLFISPNGEKILVNLESMNSKGEETTVTHVFDGATFRNIWTFEGESLAMWCVPNCFESSTLYAGWNVWSISSVPFIYVGNDRPSFKFPWLHDCQGRTRLLLRKSSANTSVLDLYDPDKKHVVGTIDTLQNFEGYNVYQWHLAPDRNTWPGLMAVIER